MAKATKRPPRTGRSGRFDVSKWAETTPPTRRGPLCVLCGSKDAREAVALIVKSRNEGRSVVSVAQTCAMLKAEFGLRVCRTSLANHVTLHMGLTW